jgi:hypothetical protein
MASNPSIHLSALHFLCLGSLLLFAHSSPLPQPCHGALPASGGCASNLWRHSWSRSLGTNPLCEWSESTAWVGSMPHILAVLCCEMLHFLRHARKTRPSFVSCYLSLSITGPDARRLQWFSTVIRRLESLCGLVVRVPGYRPRGPGSIQSLPYFLRSSGSTEPRHYNWGVNGVTCSRGVVCFQWDTNWILKYYLERNDRLCGLVVRVPGYKSREMGSIPGATRFSEK